MFREPVSPRGAPRSRHGAVSVWQISACAAVDFVHHAGGPLAHRCKNMEEGRQAPQGQPHSPGPAAVCECSPLYVLDVAQGIFSKVNRTTSSTLQGVCSEQVPSGEFLTNKHPT